MTAFDASHADLASEVTRLEAELAAARARLAAAPSAGLPPPLPPPSSPAHSLLLLADSALPLSSFAFSAGLESYLAHQGYRSWSAAGAWPASRKLGLLWPFLALSIQSLALSALPFVLAAHRAPSLLQSLDNDLDAATPCTVARRASTAQGRALLGVWERCLRSAELSGPPDAAAALDAMVASLKAQTARDDDALGLQAHLAPVWGAVCRAAGLPEQQAAYVFLLNHVKAVVSAAVRVGVCGPYKNWEILAGPQLAALLAKALREASTLSVEDAGQCVPVLDLWIGRHELLYSRIFNS